MRLEKLPRFSLEALVIHAGIDAGQINLVISAEFVLEVGVNDLLLTLFDQLDQSTQPLSRQFKQGYP